MTAMAETEAFFDYDDTNNFLSVLSESIPSLDKSADWNADLSSSMYRQQPFIKQEPFPVMLSPNGSLNDPGAVSPGSNSPNTFHGVDPAAPYASSANYSDSVDSNFFASLEHTPTSGNSPHKSPHADKHSLHTPPLSTHMSPHSDVSKAQSGSQTSMEFSQSPEDRRYRLDSTGSEDCPKSEPSDRPRAATKNKVTKPAKKGKTSHNVIEKKYRTNINSKLIELRNAVPTLRIVSGIKDVSVADLGGLAPASKLNKASVLTKATEYIKHLEKKNDSLSSKIDSLQALLNQAVSTSQPPAEAPGQNENGYFSAQFAAPEIANPNFSNSAPASVTSQSPQSPPTTNGLNQNQFMTGIGLMLGSTFITDDTFSGLAALPMFPTALGSTAASSQIAGSARCVCFFLGFLTIALSVKNVFFPASKPKARRQALSPADIMTMHLRSHEALSSADKEEVFKVILGQRKSTLSQLARQYLLLSTKQATFETTLLNVLIGVLILQRAPLASKIIGFNLRQKSRRLMSFAETDEASSKLRKLVEVDELGMFKSDSFAKRLNNLSQQLPVCADITNGENRLDFVDVYLKHKTNLYELVFSWRVLEIIHDLNLYYLELLAGPADKREDGVESIKEEMNKLKGIVEDNAFLSEKFTLFEMVVFTECSPKNLASIKAGLSKKLSAVTLYFHEDDDLSDGESGEDSERESAAEEGAELVASHSSLVYSLNLISEEKYIVMATSLISYNVEHRVNDEPLSLLHCLKFQDNKKNLSLLSFTCLVKLMSLIVKDEEDAVSEDDSEDETERLAAKVDAHNFIVLESLIKMMRGWLSHESERNIMSRGLLSELSELVIHQGLVLNDI